MNVHLRNSAPAGRIERVQDHEPEPSVATLENQVEKLEHEVALDEEVIRNLLTDGVIDRKKIANLEAALVSARRIGLAMGILMATHKITDREAFHQLRTASQSRNLKVHEIADHVALTGHLDL